VSLIHLTTWPWERYSNTTHSLRTNQERVKSFFLHFHNAGVIAKNPAAAWKRIKRKTEQASGFTQKEYEEIMQTAKRLGNAKLHALVQVMRFGGLAIIDAACLERSQIVHKGDEYRIRLGVNESRYFANCRHHQPRRIMLACKPG
jgi:site-specific recombinase XerD